jgi:hypothetical protein
VNLGLLYDFLKPAPPIAATWTFQSGAHIADAISVLTELEQRCTRYGIELYMPEFTVLAARDSKKSALEVHILPAEPVLLASARSRMQRKIKL